jgi:hypothetical protein
MEVCDTGAAAGWRPSPCPGGRRPTDEETALGGEEAEADTTTTWPPTFHFLPVIIKINNEIELTSEVPPFYGQGGQTRPPGKAVHETAVNVAPVRPANIASESETNRPTVDTIAIAASQTADTTKTVRPRGWTASDFFDSSQPVACRHLEGSPRRNAAARGCSGCQHQMPGGGKGHNGYSSTQGPQLSRPPVQRPSQQRCRGVMRAAGGSVPLSRPVLKRQDHLDTDVHPDLTRKRHSCVPTSWFRPGRSNGRHKRTESI